MGVDGALSLSALVLKQDLFGKFVEFFKLSKHICRKRDAFHVYLPEYPWSSRALDKCHKEKNGERSPHCPNHVHIWKLSQLFEVLAASKQHWELPDTHTLVRRGLQLLSFGVNKLHLTNDQVGSWTLVNIHCGLYNWRVHTSLHCTVGTQYPFQCVQFPGDRIRGVWRQVLQKPRYRLFLIGWSGAQITHCQCDIEF